MLPLGDMAFYYLRENDLICSETGDRRDLIYTEGLLLAEDTSPQSNEGKDIGQMRTLRLIG